MIWKQNALRTRPFPENREERKDKTIQPFGFRAFELPGFRQSSSEGLLTRYRETDIIIKTAYNSNFRRPILFPSSPCRNPDFIDKLISICRRTYFPMKTKNSAGRWKRIVRNLQKMKHLLFLFGYVLFTKGKTLWRKNRLCRRNQTKKTRRVCRKRTTRIANTLPKHSKTLCLRLVL